LGFHGHEMICVLPFPNITFYVLKMITINAIKLNLYTLKYFAFALLGCLKKTKNCTFMGNNPFTLEN
jgi:hypothetical protein